MKKVGILGSGIVGKTLAAGFAKHGYEVSIGTRDPQKLKDWQSEQKVKIKVDSFRGTAQSGELLVLAVKGTAAKSVVNLLKDDFRGKIVIDACNPIAEFPPEDGLLHFFTDINRSLMEDLQEAEPDARFVKGFNCISSYHMVNPDFETKPTMFICGNDEAAKKEVAGIMDTFGFETEDMGNVKAARGIEPLCMLYCIPGILKDQWNHAFKLIKIQS